MNFDEMEALLGPVTFDPPGRKRKDVAVECGQEPPPARRHTEWSNITTFTFDGYVAKVTRYHCRCCDNLWDHLVGVFICEIHNPTGTRKFSAIAKDWPAGHSYRKEVEDAEVPYCGHCIGDLGFDREVSADGQPYTHPPKAVLATWGAEALRADTHAAPLDVSGDLP